MFVPVFECIILNTIQFVPKKNLNFVTLGLLIVKLQTKYNESGNKKSGT